MIERARFVTREKQREFFLLNKGKLDVGSMRLARLLNSTRGAIESYTAGRTAPPVGMVEILESMTGIKAEYEKIKNRVVRKRRELMTMPVEEADIILKKIFKNDYEEVKELISQPVRIKDIASIMRKQYKYKFDGSVAQRAIGACRKNLQIRVVKEIEVPQDSFVVKGCISPSKNSFALRFSLKPIALALKKEKFKVGVEISEDKKNVRLFPLEQIGRSIGLSKNTLTVILPSVLDFEPKHKLNVVYCPKEFNQNYLDFIQDEDGRAIASAAKNIGLEIHPFRNTNNTNSGDLTLKILGHIVIIEITRAKTPNIAKFKIGQCLVQKVANSKANALQFILCKSNIFSREELNSLNFIGVDVIYTDFKENWPEDVLCKIIEKVKSNEISNS